MKCPYDYTFGKDYNRFSMCRICCNNDACGVCYSYIKKENNNMSMPIYNDGNCKICGLWTTLNIYNICPWCIYDVYESIVNVNLYFIQYYIALKECSETPEQINIRKERMEIAYEKLTPEQKKQFDNWKNIKLQNPLALQGIIKYG